MRMMLMLCGVLALGAGCSRNSSRDTTPSQSAMMTEDQELGQSTSTPDDTLGTIAKNESCPMEVVGAQVSTTAIDGGVALVFTTTTGDTEDLRMRVRQMATKMQSDGQLGAGMPADTGTVAGTGPATGTVTGPGPATGTAPATGTGTTGTTGTGTTGTVTAPGTGATGGMTSVMGGRVDFDATVVDIEQGARIEIRPRDRTQLERVRADVQAEASQLSSGTCEVRGGEVSVR